MNVWLPLPHPLPGTQPATQACALTGNRTHDPLVHRLALNSLSHTSQGLLLISNLPPLFINLPFLDMPHKWNHMIHDLLCLYSYYL